MSFRGVAASFKRPPRGPAETVVAAASEMHRSGLTVGSLGNFSVRRDEEIWITPTRIAVADLSPEAVVVLTVDGRQTSPGTPSRELLTHLEIYRKHPSVTAIAHTHSPWATAWSYLQGDLTLPTEELKYYAIQKIPCAPPAAAGSQELALVVAEALFTSPAVLLARHGVVATGTSPGGVLELCHLVEQQAQIHWLLRIESAASRTRSGVCVECEKHVVRGHQHREPDLWAH